MTHTSTEQPSALREAAWLRKWFGKDVERAAQELEYMHARVQELETAVETGKRLLREEMARANRYAEAAAHTTVAGGFKTADDVKEPKNGANWRVEWWNESCRMMLPVGMVLDRFQSYNNGTLQFTLKRRTHGITQEKQV